MRYWHTPEFFGATWDEWKSDDLHVVFTTPDNIGLVMDEIREEQPDYPVMLRKVGQPKYGIRAAGVEFRHVDWRRYDHRVDLDQWFAYEVATMVRPNGLIKGYRV